MTGPISLAPEQANALIAFQAHQNMQLQLQLGLLTNQRDDLARQLAEATKKDEATKKGDGDKPKDAEPVKATKGAKP